MLLSKLVTEMVYVILAIIIYEITSIICRVFAEELVNPIINKILMVKGIASSLKKEKITFVRYLK